MVFAGNDCACAVGMVAARRSMHVTTSTIDIDSLLNSKAAPCSFHRFGTFDSVYTCLGELPGHWTLACQLLHC